jgi:Cu(I)/Ag(I) efflux system periplasmic protein CusF
MSRTLALLAAALLAAPVLAQTGHPGSHPAQKAEAKAGAAKADGEVKKVDKSSGKVTIKHGPLSNLDMPAMTMVFRVKDPAMLDQLKSGDSIKFRAEKIGGNYTVTEFQPAK